MIRRQGAASELLIGACSQWAILRRAMANGPGPFSVAWARPAASVSEDTRQYGLSALRDSFALAVDACRSAITPVFENFSIAPSCSCDALIVLNTLRANQTPAIRNESCMTKLAGAYQLSLMFSPWTARASSYNWEAGEETGTRSK